MLTFYQYDMTAFVKRGQREEIGAVMDFTHPGFVFLRNDISFTNSTLSSLMAFVKQLIDTYLDIPYAETRCGYACSDQ